MEDKYKICPQCGNDVYHNKGIGKNTGVPYENYKCPKCGWIEWVDNKAFGSKKQAPKKSFDDKAIAERLDKIEQSLKIIYDLLKNKLS